MRRTFPLFLAAAFLLLAAPPRAEAQLYRAYYPQGRVYVPPRPVYPSVYVFPQIRTSYYPALPYYGWGAYSPGWYGGYAFNPGAYRYSYTPWGASYYYTNPSYYFWYRGW